MDYRSAGTRGLLIRLRAAARGERGFSLLETVIAIGTIFVSLTALAFSATAGFRYIGLSRERQAANQLANELMESTRGLAFANVKNGLSRSDVLAEVALSDANPDKRIFPSCVSGDPAETYRFPTCSGAKVIWTDGLSSQYPIVPHQGTIGQSQGYPVEYSWRTYVTNDDAAHQPYQVTVIVSWTGGGIQGVSRTVQSQGLFWSPSGCLSDETHPFSAPCQPFFYGRASAEQGRIDFASPTDAAPIAGAGFKNGSLILSGADASLQAEQVSQASSSFSPTEASFVENGVVSAIVPPDPLVAVADSDPATGSPEVSRVPVSGGYAVTKGSISTSSGSVVTLWTGNDSDPAQSNDGDAISTMASNLDCPTWLPQSTGEPCSSARVQQIGEVGGSVDLSGFAVDLGPTLLARIAGVSQVQQTEALSQFPSSGGAPENVVQSVERTIGQVDIGGLPAALASGPQGWEGSFIRLTGFSQSASAEAGTNAPSAPGASITGSLSYWNQPPGSPSGSWATVSLGTPFEIDSEISSVVNGVEVRVRMIGSSPGAGTTTDQQACADQPSATCSASASVAAPLTGTFEYSITLTDANGVTTVADIAFAVNLGAVTASGLYQPAPTAT